jgi:Tfp pilus assembly protein FimT
MIKSGYTMIELLIILAVSGLLISLGTSSYRKAQERQTMRADVESILQFLQGAQKEAVIGQKDCAGILTGIRLEFTAGYNVITKQAVCQSDVGTTKEVRLQTARSTSSLQFLFRPLDGSTDLPPGDTTLAITSQYGTAGNIIISSTGSITHAQN